MQQKQTSKVRSKYFILKGTRFHNFCFAFLGIHFSCSLQEKTEGEKIVNSCFIAQNSKLPAQWSNIQKSHKYAHFFLFSVCCITLKSH
jgi:hypothetical protein